MCCRFPDGSCFPLHSLIFSTGSLLLLLLFVARHKCGAGESYFHLWTQHSPWNCWMWKLLFVVAQTQRSGWKVFPMNSIIRRLLVRVFSAHAHEDFSLVLNFNFFCAAEISIIFTRFFFSLLAISFPDTALNAMSFENLKLFKWIPLWVHVEVLLLMCHTSAHIQLQHFFSFHASSGFIYAFVFVTLSVLFLVENYSRWKREKQVSHFSPKKHESWWVWLDVGVRDTKTQSREEKLL